MDIQNAYYFVTYHDWSRYFFDSLETNGIVVVEDHTYRWDSVDFCESSRSDDVLIYNEEILSSG